MEHPDELVRRLLELGIDPDILLNEPEYPEIPLPTPEVPTGDYKLKFTPIDHNLPNKNIYLPNKIDPIDESESYTSLEDLITKQSPRDEYPSLTKKYFSTFNKMDNDLKLHKNFNHKKYITKDLIEHEKTIAGLGDLFNNILDNPYQKPVRKAKVPTPTAFTELSAEYATKIAELPEGVTLGMVEATRQLLGVAPLLSAVAEYTPLLNDKRAQPSRDNRSRIARFIALQEELDSTKTEVHQAVHAARPRSFIIYDTAKNSPRVLNQMLIDGNACTQVPSSAPEDHTPAAQFALDSKAGGSVHFTITDTNGTSYSRAYLAVDKDDDVVLFHDCTESGNIMWRTVKDYVTNGIASRLSGSFAATLTLANQLGIDSVAFAEDELLALARELGFGEQNIFPANENLYGRKLGNRCSSFAANLDGPYAWRLGKERGYRTVDATLFSSDAISGLEDQLASVVDRVTRSPKQRNQLRKDVGQYLSIIDQLTDRVVSSYDAEQAARMKESISAVETLYDTQLFERVSVPRNRIVQSATVSEDPSFGITSLLSTYLSRFTKGAKEPIVPTDSRIAC